MRQRPSPWRQIDVQRRTQDALVARRHLWWVDRCDALPGIGTVARLVPVRLPGSGRWDLRVAYVAGDGPLEGWAYAADRRLPLNEELELSVRDGYSAVYRVGQECKLWFVHLLPPTPSGAEATP